MRENHHRRQKLHFLGSWYSNCVGTWVDTMVRGQSCEIKVWLVLEIWWLSFCSQEVAGGEWKGNIDSMYRIFSPQKGIFTKANVCNLKNLLNKNFEITVTKPGPENLKSQAISPWWTAFQKCLARSSFICFNLRLCLAVIAWHLVSFYLRRFYTTKVVLHTKKLRTRQCLRNILNI